MGKNLEDIEPLIENEREWRRYMIRKLDRIESDLNIFKIKAYGFIAVLTAVFNVISEYLRNGGK